MKLVSTSTKTPIYKLIIDDVDCTNLGRVKDDHVLYSISRKEFKTIKVILLNKEPFDTVVIDNKIVEDLMVIIDGLSIDNISLYNELSKISVYKDLQDKIWQTNGYITFNGCMTIKIHKNLLYTKWLAGIM